MSAEPTVLDIASTGLQVYFQSPYLTGVAFSEFREQGYEPSTALASLLAPIPRLGADFRQTNGSRIYNRAIYGGVSYDQILPLWAEVELSLGLPLLIVIGLAVGMLFQGLETWLVTARSHFAAYAIAFSSLWLAQTPIVSISVLAQVTYYFVAPLLLACLLLRNDVGNRSH